MKFVDPQPGQDIFDGIALFKRLATEVVDRTDREHPRMKLIGELWLELANAFSYRQPDAVFIDSLIESEKLAACYLVRLERAEEKAETWRQRCDDMCASKDWDLALRGVDSEMVAK